MTGLNLIIGREAGMPFGHASGLDHAHVVPLNIVIETIQVLAIHPLLVLSTRQVHDGCARRLRFTPAGA